MSILVNKNTKIIVQGLTGKTGTFHTEQALAITVRKWLLAHIPKKAAKPDECRWSKPTTSTVAKQKIVLERMRQLSIKHLAGAAAAIEGQLMPRLSRLPVSPKAFRFWMCKLRRS